MMKWPNCRQYLSEAGARKIHLGRGGSGGQGAQGITENSQSQALKKKNHPQNQCEFYSVCRWKKVIHV